MFLSLLDRCVRENGDDAPTCGLIDRNRCETDEHSLLLVDHPKLYRC